MEVDLAVLADAANRSDNGKLNILGVFDSLTLGPDFPAASPTFAIVVRVVLHRTELGDHRFELRIADADGREISKLEGNFEVARVMILSLPEPEEPRTRKVGGLYGFKREESSTGMAGDDLKSEDFDSPSHSLGESGRVAVNTG